MEIPVPVVKIALRALAGEREGGPIAPDSEGPRPGDRLMDLADKVLRCADCASEFVFTAGEQLFFRQQQFKNDPKRCKPCKSKRGAGGAGARPETAATCSQCGAQTTVPFLPTQGRPVLCRFCFQSKRDPPQPPINEGPQSPESAPS